MVDFVAMHQRAAAASLGGEALGDHGQHLIEILPCEIAIRPGTGHQREELVFAIVVARRLGDDLLREHVERGVVGDDAVERSAADLAQ